MSFRTRILLILVILGAASFPAMTGHALTSAVVLHDHATGALSPLHLEAVPLAALTLLSALPLLAMLRGGIRWTGAVRKLRHVTRGAPPRRWGDISYVRIPGDQVTLFTAGVWRPAIYVSTAAERELSGEAFRAALLHEQAHLRHHDPFWLALAGLAEASVGWLPSARPAFADLRIKVEWQADQAALRSGAKREGLFDAIVVAATGTRFVAALTGAGATDRLRWLAEPDLQPSGESGMGKAFTGLLMPPLLAHALVWTGLVCALCAHHLS